MTWRLCITTYVSKYIIIVVLHHELQPHEHDPILGFNSINLGAIEVIQKLNILF